MHWNLSSFHSHSAENGAALQSILPGEAWRHTALVFSTAIQPLTQRSLAQQQLGG
jgi:hypothetical protein